MPMWQREEIQKVLRSVDEDRSTSLNIIQKDNKTCCPFEFDLYKKYISMK